MRVEREYGANAIRASNRPWPELKFLVNDNSMSRQTRLTPHGGASAQADRQTYRATVTAGLPYRLGLAYWRVMAACSEITVRRL